MRRERQALAEEFGEVQVQFVAGRRSVALSPGSPDVPCEQSPSWVEGAFHGVISAGGQLYLHSTTRLPGGRPERSCLTAPVDAKLLNQVGGDAGPYSMILLEEETESAGGARFSLDDKNFTAGQTLEPESAALPEPGYFFDPSIVFASSFQVVLWDIQNSDRATVPILLSLTTRASLLNQRIFAPLGERGFSQVFLLLLAVVGVILLLVQLVAVITGVRLTRSITHAVHELYAATLGVQAGDFSVRIKTKRDDQLGTLCDSFNQMAASIEGLIEESKARQRLENEVEIARQVQEQLFPREAPLLNTLQMAGRCVPASGVSGDYYDFGQSAPGKLVLTIGDISGKGISAALLMASIQATLRGQVYSSRLAGQLDQLSVADLVGRVNRQLCANTSPEKYSTLFVAFYNDETRELTYTNAGHLPPMLVRNGSLDALTTGGAVVGLFKDIQYEQETVTLQPKDCLVAYTDGVTEMENSYEEDYGIPRLQDFLRRSEAGLNPDRLIDVVFDELEVWAPGAEASDDRTLLVARAL
jgi:sigma-B regulation protein RsbU (phosphoserine phosphatase)